MVPVNCAASLLVAVPHFNYRTELLKIMVSQLSRRKVDAAFEKCREALESLFKEDDRASFEAVSMLSKMVKSRKYRVDPKVIEMFQVLEISTAAAEAEVSRTKAQRKRRKDKKLEKELAEAEAQVSLEERERLQSDILKVVFGLYFRILKESQDKEMLRVVLDGISRFTRLINAEFFGDLLEVLREILERGEIEEQLLCLHAAFELLANQDTKVDLSFFVERFYDLLLELSVRPLRQTMAGGRSMMEMVIRILDLILFSGPTSPTRIVGFYKRLLTCSLHGEEKEACLWLKLLQRLGSRFPKRVESVWEEGKGWELALLKKYSGRVSEMTRELYSIN